MKFQATVDAVNAEISRRKQTGEAMPDAAVASFEMAAMTGADGRMFLRCIFRLTDNSTFSIDTTESFALDELRGALTLH